MTPLLYRLGGLCVRHRWVVLAVWLTIFALLGAAARSVGPELNDDLRLPGSDSQAATDLLSDRFPAQANGTNPVVLKAPGGAKITDKTYKGPIDDTVAAFKRDPDVRDATSPLSGRAGDTLAKDKRTTPRPERRKRVLRTAHEACPNGQISPTGDDRAQTRGRPAARPRRGSTPRRRRRSAPRGRA